jgi:hypothetical protein
MPLRTWGGNENNNWIRPPTIVGKESSLSKLLTGCSNSLGYLKYSFNAPFRNYQREGRKRFMKIGCCCRSLLGRRIHKAGPRSEGKSC